MRKYESSFLPRMSEYYSLSKKKAEVYFFSFLNEVPIHVDNLKTAMESDGVDCRKLDFSDSSLIPVWSWFIERASTREFSKQELSERIKLFGKLGPTMIGSRTLTDETELMAQDIGLYMAMVFIKNYRNISWDYVKSPKSDMFYQNPVLTGFINNNYGKPFYAVFPPVHMAGVQAVKLIDGRAAKNDLFNLYKIWEPYAKEGLKLLSTTENTLP